MLSKLKLLLLSVPWWGWLAGFLIVLFIWQSLSGWAYSSKLFNMALDNLRTDQSNVVRVLEENMASYEKEIKELQRQVTVNKQQQAQVRAENELLWGRIRELQKARDTIVIPSDPDRIVDLLRSMGFKSERRIRAK